MYNEIWIRFFVGPIFSKLAQELIPHLGVIDYLGLIDYIDYLGVILLLDRIKSALLELCLGLRKLPQKITQRPLLDVSCKTTQFRNCQNI
jgi:hypothetical protein